MTLPPAEHSLYAISFCAQKTTDTVVPSNKKFVYWEHMPVLLVAKSLEDATQQAITLAVSNWPKPEWEDRSVSIRRVSNAFVAHLDGSGFIFPDADPANATFINIDERFRELK